MLSSLFLSYVLLALGGVESVLGTTPHHGKIITLDVRNKNLSPDGRKRSTVVAGGEHPGPLVSGFKGDRFRVNVVNNLKDDTMLKTTSIHWHGVFMEKSAWADGVASITQCPIVPGESFLYEFNVNQAGTFWWHSHDSTQYCDGLRGPMIVYDRNDPHRGLYDVDDESTIISLSDWYNVTALSVGLNQAPPIPTSVLINGKGRYPGGKDVDLAVVTVQRGKRYRLRIINISCDPNFKFSIDGHRLRVIEVETENIEPYWVDSLQVFAGQRYSAILHADQPIDNYWIRSEPNVNHGPQGFEGGINSAILRYVGAKKRDPTTSINVNAQKLKETDLRPHSSPNAPGYVNGQVQPADVSLKLWYAFDQTISRYRLNNATFSPPDKPVLLQILSGAKRPEDLLPKDSIISLPPNKVIELEIAGSGQGLHPFHMHGHTFSVVKSAESSVYNYKNPVRRDTVNVGVGSLGETAVIRWKTDNSGPWFLHCHIDWHLELGLATVFVEDIPGIKKQDTPKQWDQLCPKYEKYKKSQNKRELPLSGLY